LGPSEKNGRRKDESRSHFAVLVILGATEISAQDLASGVSSEPTADELHRTIRRFRRAQASRYSIESLLGNSLVMQKVRSQLAAASASGANTLICGPPGSGRGHAARAIHYCAATDAGSKLIPIDCRLLSDDLLRRILERLRNSEGSPAQRPTLLLENLEQMPAPHQSLLASAIQEKLLAARIIATSTGKAIFVAGQTDRPATNGSSASAPSVEVDSTDPVAVDSVLLNAVSTITVDLPSLVDRIEDLPVLAQYFLEASNHGSSKQVGSFRRDALDRMALYSWPGQLDQLHEAVTAAHRVAKSHEISTADLPTILEHASRAAKQSRREPERIVLDELLGSIEKEAIVRALSQAGGNKSEAAALLGMTRPRLYRRLVQLGLAREGEELQVEQPEFIERDAAE
jgi:DNA-binding NtrC family response regulator